MHRREFLGASLAGIIAALSLPFERFAEWCKQWMGSREDVILMGSAVMNFEVGQRIALNLGGAFAGINRDSDTARYGTATITSIDRRAGTITVAA